MRNDRAARATETAAGSPRNVVRFDESPRWRSMRRGTPDKLPAAPHRGLELECPRCGAVLRVVSDPAAGAPEIPCAGCDAVLAVRPEPIELRR